ncbi:MAG: proline--tRNA ligase [Bacillota bacterium]
MKMSEFYLPTLKEDPAEAEIVSHKLMLRAGMIRKHSSGIYSYLPLAWRVIKKIEKIVRREMDRAGSQEVLLPVMQSAEIWKDSERWEDFGPLMIKFEDRKGREYCLGPTHEEVVTDLVRDEVRSYKDLPFNLYQIQTKVRDEIRPRFGVMRGREFMMKDAYSLDRDYAGLDDSYQAMYDAYSNVFASCGLETRVVEADTGAMGGKDSHEFMVLADDGEDDIVLCPECDYAANNERAYSVVQDGSEMSEEEKKELTTKKTPGQKTIEDLTSFLDVSEKRLIKAVAVLADGEPVLALVRGDDQLNEIKLKNYLQAVELQPVPEEEFSSYFGSPAGFVGPIGLEDVKIIADNQIKSVVNGVSGANQLDVHYINVNPERDFKVTAYTDLRLVKQGDLCKNCGSQLEIKSGIEVGHIFKLGTKYSSSMDATYLDDEGQEKPIVMGSYGIGITRLVAAAIEQNHDQYGIIWPQAIAPFQVIILPLGGGKEIQETAFDLYEFLQENDVEVLLDDRQERAGVKFNDADLIGIPLRITIGSRSLENGVLEVKERASGEEYNIPLGDAGNKILEKIEQMK